MINELAQSGVASVTHKERVEAPDFLKVKLLTGTARGQVGEIVVLSTSVALREIEKGFAVAV